MSIPLTSHAPSRSVVHPIPVHVIPPPPKKKQSYPDFCRSLYEEGIEPLNIATSELEKAYGKVCGGVACVCIW